MTKFQTILHENKKEKERKRLYLFCLCSLFEMSRSDDMRNFLRTANCYSVEQLIDALRKNVKDIHFYKRDDTLWTFEECKRGAHALHHNNSVQKLYIEGLTNKHIGNRIEFLTFFRSLGKFQRDEQNLELILQSLHHHTSIQELVIGIEDFELTFFCVCSHLFVKGDHLGGTVQPFIELLHNNSSLCVLSICGMKNKRQINESSHHYIL